MRAQRGRLPRAAAQMRADEDDRMVLQIAADAGQIGQNVDAERAQLGRRADAGAQQESRRVNGAGAYDDHPLGISLRAPSTVTVAPTTRFPSRISPSTVAPVMIVRFLRARTLASR